MSGVQLPILCVPFCQTLIKDHEQVFRVLLLCRLREIEATGYDRLVLTLVPTI